MSTEKRVRVFVVDDEEVIARTIAVILNGKGFEATAFSVFTTFNDLYLHELQLLASAETQSIAALPKPARVGEKPARPTSFLCH